MGIAFCSPTTGAWGGTIAMKGGGCCCPALLKLAAGATWPCGFGWPDPDPGTDGAPGPALPVIATATGTYMGIPTNKINNIAAKSDSSGPQLGFGRPRGRAAMTITTIYACTTTKRASNVKENVKYKKHVSILGPKRPRIGARVLN